MVFQNRWFVPFGITAMRNRSSDPESSGFPQLEMSSIKVEVAKLRMSRFREGMDEMLGACCLNG
jgi:hypothetical protein